MARGTLAGLLALITAAGGGCSSSSNTIPCSYSDPAVLAQSSWPKFRHDLANTGNLTGVDLAAASYAVQWVFPPRGQAGAGSFASSPVLNTNESLLYIGSSDHNVYAINTADGSLNNIPIAAGGPITATPMAAVRYGVDALFVGGGNGLLYAIQGINTVQAEVWPATLNGFIAGSPTTNGVDGTIYAVALNGNFGGYCPNGVLNYTTVVASTQSSIAIGPGATLYFGGDDRLLRATAANAVPLWTFAMSGPIVASPVVDAAANTVYAADNNGRVFLVNNVGQPVAGFTAPHVGPVSGSPALAGGTLYVPSEDGTLYAINGSTGNVTWPLPADGPIYSSPAVATSAAGNRVVVFAASAPSSSVFLVEDTRSAPNVLAVCPLRGTVRPCLAGTARPKDGTTIIESSPAIRASDGTIYVGADDGVYAIAPMWPAPTPTPTP